MTPGLQYGWSELHALALAALQVHSSAASRAVRPRGRSAARQRTSSASSARHRRATWRRSWSGVMATTSRGAPAPEAANLDKETLERLASLGYVGGAAPRQTTAGRARRSEGQARGVHGRPARGRADGRGRLRRGRAGARIGAAVRAGDAAGAADAGVVVYRSWGARRRPRRSSTVSSRTTRRASRG